MSSDLTVSPVCLGLIVYRYLMLLNSLLLKRGENIGAHL